MMEIETAAGRLLLVGFERNTFDEELARLLSEIRPAGVILFAHNIAGAAEVAALVQQIVQALAEHGPPGGLPCWPWTWRAARWTSCATCWHRSLHRDGGSYNDDLFVRDFGELVGEALASFGLNVDLAPVLDLASTPAEPVLGPRAVSADPPQVVRFGRNFLAGLTRRA